MSKTTNRKKNSLVLTNTMRPIFYFFCADFGYVVTHRHPRYRRKKDNPDLLARGSCRRGRSAMDTVRVHTSVSDRTMIQLQCRVVYVGVPRARTFPSFSFSFGRSRCGDCCPHGEDEYEDEGKRGNGPLWRFEAHAFLVVGADTVMFTWGCLRWWK